MNKSLAFFVFLLTVVSCAKEENNTSEITFDRLNNCCLYSNEYNSHKGIHYEMILVGGDFKDESDFVTEIENYACKVVSEINLLEFKAYFLSFYLESEISNVKNMSKDRGIFDSYSISHDNLANYTWRNGTLKSITWNLKSTNRSRSVKDFNCH